MMEPILLLGSDKFGVYDTDVLENVHVRFYERLVRIKPEF